MTHHITDEQIAKLHDSMFPAPYDGHAKVIRFARALLALCPAAPVGFTCKPIVWAPRQSEMVVKVTRNAQPDFGFTHAIYPEPRPSIAPRPQAAPQGEPVAAQCRFEGDAEWKPCTVAHHLLVQAHPKDWPHYETRALYTAPAPQGEPVSAALSDIVALWDLDAPLRYNEALHMQAKRALAGEPPVSPDLNRWCVYVAGMISGWLEMARPQIMSMGDEARTKAIAGLIERRLWAMPKDTAPAPAVPSDERAALQRIADWSEHPPMLGVDYGSNGVRDYYRKIARDALIASTAAPAVPSDIMNMLLEIHRRPNNVGIWLDDLSRIVRQHREALTASPTPPAQPAVPDDVVEAMRDGLSVCRSVSTCRDRKIVRDGVTLYAQTEEWCRWLEDEVGPKIETALEHIDAARAAEKGGE